MSRIYKYKCVKCGKHPSGGWLYMPEDGDNVDYFYCDDCVPRGCSCNSELKEGIEWDSEEAKNPDNYYEPVDEKGRKYPCCEYWWFEKNGFDQKQRLSDEML